MKLPRRLTLGLTAALCLGLAAPSLAQDALKVGSYPANPPWETKTESGAFEGFEVDIVNEVAKRMGTRSRAWISRRCSWPLLRAAWTL
jgi:polar amino acid transport system substrate-binding protein